MEETAHSNQSARPSLRQVLTDSHVAAITIALLLIFSLESIIYALEKPLIGVGSFLLRAVAILDIPYFSSNFDALDRLTAINSAAFLYSAIVYGLAAVFLSHWVFGVGPIRSLRQYRNSIVRSHSA
jgi:hypothetical protein